MPPRKKTRNLVPGNRHSACGDKFLNVLWLTKSSHLSYCCLQQDVSLRCKAGGHAMAHMPIYGKTNSVPHAQNYTNSE